ncbi:MAG: hypothetical protein VKJ64_05070 [Leptolyngbyaceae bacterium]|nr:hypothetical protein [Leptolyngbyaceae bacterium]
MRVAQGVFGAIASLAATISQLYAMLNPHCFRHLKSAPGQGQQLPLLPLGFRSLRSSVAALVAAGILCCSAPALASTPISNPGQSPDTLVGEALTASPSASLEPNASHFGPNAPPNLNVPSLNIDPIGSPHLLPWSWVMDVQSRAVDSTLPQLFYFRSPALVSPNGTHAAYSRMQIKRVVDASQSQVSSILFLENLETGDIQFLTASSPNMQHVLLHGIDSQQPGMLSMLMPVSWTEEGDRVLVRAFEAIFNTDIAADYAIIWHQPSNQADAIVPTNAQYSNAVLLGWSQSQPDRALFQVGNLGDEAWPLVTVGETGDSTIATTDQPITYGQTVSAVWNGPQISALDSPIVD